jgi:hypothetical protein
MMIVRPLEMLLELLQPELLLLESMPEKQLLAQ